MTETIRQKVRHLFKQDKAAYAAYIEELDINALGFGLHLGGFGFMAYDPATQELLIWWSMRPQYKLLALVYGK